jgi:hypothetical protein
VCKIKYSFIENKTKTHDDADAVTAGSPSNTTTLSARYVAIMKSCSTTNAVFLACKINLETELV